MDVSGRDNELFLRAVQALERSAGAHEKLNALAEEEATAELEPAPPHCPHCGKINPDVMVTQELAGIIGPMADIAMQLKCLTCEKTFYATSLAWLSTGSLQDMKDYFAERERAGINE